MCVCMCVNSNVNDMIVSVQCGGETGQQHALFFYLCMYIMTLPMNGCCVFMYV